jgi:hypothetical protein
MKKLPILLLIYLLSISITNANKMEAPDIWFNGRSTSNYMLDVSSNDVNLITFTEFSQAPQFVPETEAAPPTLWIVGLGLCLVFLGYKIKTKSSKIN